MIINKEISLIALGYSLYVFLFIVGASTHNKVLNLVGAVSFFLIVGYKAGFLFVSKYKYEKIQFIFYVVIVSSVISFILNYDRIDYLYFVKYLYIYIYVLFVLQLKLRPLYDKNSRISFLVVIGFLILYSLLFGETSNIEGEARFAGVFVNSNNLSLMSLCLLFFISSSDGLILKVVLHALVVFLIIKSGTSGAFVAYLFGMMILFWSKYRMKYNYVLFMLFALLALIFIISFEKIYLVDRIFMQYQVMRDGLNQVLSGQSVNYYLLGQYYGFGALSGLWRLDHWLSMLEIYFQQDFMTFLFGFGIGSTESVIKTLPHNDYLRILFEVGVVGLYLFVSLFVFFYKKIDKNYRYVFIIIVFFMFTENIIDNILFMSLFVLWIGSVFPQYDNNAVYYY